MPPLLKTMRLHKRTFFTIVLGATVLVVVIFLASWIAIMGGFSRLEKISVQRNIFRAQEVVADRLNNLAVKLADWTTWDDTYVFIEDKNQAYIQSNLQPLVLDNLKIETMMFFNARGELVHSLCAQHPGTKPHLPSEDFKKSLGVLLAHQDEKSSIEGIVMLDEGPLLVASRPIIKSDGQGPMRGTVIFAAQLDVTEMQRLSQIVRAEMSVEKITAVAMPPDFAAARTAFLNGDSIFLNALDAKTVAGYSLLKDISGNDVLILKVAMSREITQFGRRTLFYFFLALVVVGFIFGAVVYVPLEREIAGRDQAEKAFRIADARYRELVEGTDDLITIVDRRGCFTYVNHSAEKIFGLKPEDCLGRSAFDFVHLDDREKTQKVFEGWLRDKNKHQVFQNRQVNKNGQVFEMFWTVNVYFTDSGEVAQVCSFGRNISDLKRAEKEILKARQFFESVIDSLPGIFYLLDNQRKMIRVNDNFLRISGYSLEEVMGMDPLDFFPENEKEKVKRGITLVFEKGGALVEVDFLSKNGKKTPYHLTGRRVMIDGVPFLAGVGIDIADRKKVEAALEESEKRFMEILYASKDAILLIDGEKFVDCNEAAARMLRYSTREEFMMTHPSELSPLQQPDGASSFEKANEMMARAFEQGFYQFEWINKKADGEEFPVEVSLTPIVMHGKNILHCLWRDMTENKYLAAALNKFHENLEIQVKERTEELVRSFQKLQATDEELQRASKAKSEFLANMSHELRTPLNSIIGFSEVLYDERFGPLNEKQKKYTQNVMVSGQHLLALINDVLDLSKVEAGKMVLEASSFSLLGCAEEVFRMVEPQSHAKKIKLVKEIPEDVDEIRADQRKIKQILCNLLSNAIKFTPVEGKVGIRAKKIDAGIEVAVWDTGVGISPENLEKVFGAFERLGDVYTQETEGTGLGLTISRKMVELHGGKIWIESEGGGKGATVKFTIPGRGV